tara:strand:- start:50 stop:340 length:291 start_codon:yes stop_codon:yes gene_type:complete
MKKKVYTFYLIFLIVIPFIFIFLPINFFDSGDSICLSIVLFNKECYGCGMTRAIQHLIHFDFKGAYDFNKLSFIVLPILIYLLFKEIKKVSKKILN